MRLPLNYLQYIKNFEIHKVELAVKFIVQVVITEESHDSQFETFWLTLY